MSRYNSENLLHLMLKDILAEERFQHLGAAVHVPLSQFLRNREDLTGEERRYMYHPMTHADFLIYNRITHESQAVIEVDAYQFHHEGTQQYERDQLKKAILEKYRIPCLRVRTDGSRERERIVSHLERLV